MTRVRAPIFAKGFRPFFWLAGAFAVLVVPLWALVLFGYVRIGGHLDPVTWHAHEMVFGFAGAVISGFLLTAAGNWTKKETATGGPLVVLAAIWLAGRLAMAFGASLPPWLVASVDLAFLPAVAFAIGRPIAMTRSRRNYVIVGLLLAMTVANAAVHGGAPRQGLLVGVDLVTFLMVVIAGRIVPMFTRNATRAEDIRSHGKLDVAAAISILGVAIADLRPSPALTLATCATASVFVATRAIHWGGLRSMRDPLLWILHIGHAWIPIGLGLRAISAVYPLVPPSLGLHAITAGAIGSLTIGMMARVSLGHTGRAMVASRGIAAAFALVTLAAGVRVFIPLFVPGLYLTSLAVTAILWSLAFATYLVTFTPILVARRGDGKPG